MNGGADVRDAQRWQWQTTFEANPHLYGTDPSAPGAYAVELFGGERVGHVLELGAGQGRDTLAFPLCPYWPKSQRLLSNETYLCGWAARTPSPRSELAPIAVPAGVWAAFLLSRSPRLTCGLPVETAMA